MPSKNTNQESAKNFPHKASEPVADAETVQEPVEESKESNVEECPACNGTGLKDGAPDATELCANCGGDGVVEKK